MKPKPYIFPSYLCSYSRNPYPSMGLPEQHHAGLAADIELLVFVNDRAYVPETPLEAERRKI